MLENLLFQIEYWKNKCQTLGEENLMLRHQTTDTLAVKRLSQEVRNLKLENRRLCRQLEKPIFD